MSAVWVVGSLHLDVVVRAPHLPASDETVMGSSVNYVCGGKGGNQAVAAAHHGAATCMTGRVGDDAFGQRLVANLAGAAVAVDCVQTGTGEASGMSVAIVDAAGDYGAVVVSAANQTIAVADIRIPPDCGVLVLQNEVAQETNLGAAKLARQAGAPVVLNAAPMRHLPNELLDLVDVLVVNRVEAGALFEVPVGTPDHALEVCRARKAGPRDLLLTLGGDGVVWHRIGSLPRHFPAFAVSVQSSHGAGDVFVGALSARLVDGDAMDLAIRYAQAAAALHVSADLFTRETISPATVAGFLGKQQA